LWPPATPLLFWCGPKAVHPLIPDALHLLPPSSPDRQSCKHPVYILRRNKKLDKELPGSLYFQLHAFFFLEGMDNAEQIFCRGVATGAEHAHEAFGRFVGFSA